MKANWNVLDADRKGNSANERVLMIYQAQLAVC